MTTYTKYHPGHRSYENAGAYPFPIMLSGNPAWYHPPPALGQRSTPVSPPRCSQHANYHSRPVVPRQCAAWPVQPPSQQRPPSRGAAPQYRSTSQPRRQVTFYHKYDPHYGFTNFSPHPIIYKGKTYPTSEHLFQSFKFMHYRPHIAEHIRTCSSRPSVAFSEARKFDKEKRSDWFKVNIRMMDEVLWQKFNQHPQLRDELLATRDAELIESSNRDAFWGWGPDRRGKNELGKALERVRSRFQHAYTSR